MTMEHYGLLDMPFWLFITLPLVSGVVGEMWRADKEGVTGRSLVRRLIMRSGSSMVCGASAIMLLHAANVSIWAVCAGGCLTAMAGTDVVLGLYERWMAKRLGVRSILPHEAEN
ncbi:phage holin family protein [Pseudomonas fluorescens]|uniref:Pyocin R2, holin n=1 Tax=Pseudomonas fluorescens TaxID=294 RepID=A0A5E7GUH9_PSEFL|nr:phage holin family protein [Pseudomonas fluorescens]VVO55529.1 hypothetical protein PS854_00517 [Pseudomonas fluorescens]